MNGNNGYGGPPPPQSFTPAPGLSPPPQAYTPDPGTSQTAIGPVTGNLPVAQRRSTLFDDNPDFRRQQACAFGCLLCLGIIVGIVIGVLNKDESDPLVPTPDPITLPTEAPIPTYIYSYSEITSFLVSRGISDQALFDDSETPQAKAARFLEIDSSKFSIDMESDKYIERYVLAVLFYSTGGPTWKHKMRFVTHSDVCGWNEKFLKLTGVTTTEGVICTNNTASILDMPQKEMSGSLPSELGYLSNTLEKVHLGFNLDLGGSIPSTFSNLTALLSLEVPYCSITGTLPEGFGSTLERLAVSNNLLTGQIPTSILESTSLQVFAADDNSLSANIADFNITKVKYLYIDDNEITGEFTSDVLANFATTEELDLSGNKLKSKLPSDVFVAMPKLSVLDLSGNEIYGTIPDTPIESVSVNQSIALNFVALHDNALTGTIPTAITTLTTLRHLDLSRNQLSSTIPDTWGELIDLEYLFLGSNNYDPQPFPTALTQLRNLEELSLKESTLTGSIPASVGGIRKLIFLDLHSNELTGIIPNEIGDKMARLKFILLNKNKLSGSIPSNFEGWESLELLFLDHNQFTGSAAFICDSPYIAIEVFVTDCSNVTNCACCTTCCDAADDTCNAGDWHGNVDPIWEYGYQRWKYTFTNNTIDEEPIDNPGNETTGGDMTATTAPTSMPTSPLTSV